MTKNLTIITRSKSQIILRLIIILIEGNRVAAMQLIYFKLQHKYELIHYEPYNSLDF